MKLYQFLSITENRPKGPINNDVLYRVDYGALQAPSLMTYQVRPCTCGLKRHRPKPGADPGLTCLTGWDPLVRLNQNQSSITYDYNIHSWSTDSDEGEILVHTQKFFTGSLCVLNCRHHYSPSKNKCFC
ncbi:hypothetical protein ABEB36_003673 [Hypothenemus hampei]|uniref:Uncharacterized protein n=1 Tax=Hypothenemus hampei TaxID=57062 RepID=A0ABD1F3C9_HYPHA